jgi:adenine-specific DNA-methyltransferase
MEDRTARLTQLTDLFAANYAQYMSSGYDEANTRTDFIDRFFEEVLDWDVRNKEGCSEVYRDVVREDKVIINGQTKAPDYSFLFGGTVKFYVEAKKPSVNIKDNPEPAYQVRRYAWTKKLPLSILTNLSEFAIYDTRIKPTEKDSTSVARIFYCTFKEYEKHLDFIYGIFSKQAIRTGSFDKYVEENRNKKGTSEVDSELLSLVEEWRMELAKNIALHNNDISIYNLNTVVQKIIDRIIFLRIAEDKGIEDADLLKTVSQCKNVYAHLNQLFINANNKYNAGLFKTEDWIENVAIDDKVLQNIIVNLYYPKSPYEFSVLPIEILGNIYEKFLGKTITFRGVKGGHTAVIEEKPEVKKAGGVYYTPQYIVDYIVQHTVGVLIKDKTPEEIRCLRFVDPACGSGSFLVGAYQYLLNYHLDYYSNEANLKSFLKKEKIYEAAHGTYKLTISEKQKILQNNIYGVDIDSQAVEVTKLSLYLKLLENEGKEAEGQLFKFTDIKLLPSLENNIKCGNSLIGTDFYAQGDLGLTDEEQFKVNCFDWEREFEGDTRVA